MIKAEKLRKPIKNIFYLFCYFKKCELFCTNCNPPESREGGYQIHAKHTTKSIKIYNTYILYDYTSYYDNI